MGGTPFGRGDVSYLIPVFRDLSISVSFRNPDGYFGPQLNLLYDAGTIEFMHFETMFYMASHVLQRLGYCSDPLA